jgi:hypothetical protein
LSASRFLAFARNDIVVNGLLRHYTGIQYRQFLG